MKTIELNEQQVEFLKETLSEDLIEASSKTWQAIARQIISKLEEDNG